MLGAGQEQKRLRNLSLHPEMSSQSLNSACRLSTSSGRVLVVQRGRGSGVAVSPWVPPLLCQGQAARQPKLFPWFSSKI